MGTTTKHALPYPDGTDPNDVPQDMEDLADAIDVLMATVIEGTLAARPAFGKLGRFYRTTDTGEVFFDTGVSWLEVALGDLASFLPLAGGTMTGDVNFADFKAQRPYLQDYAEVLRTVGASGAAQTIDYSVAQIQDITLDQNSTFTFSNPPATGRVGSLTVIVRQPGVLRAVTWPASVDWPNGAAPTMAINTVNMFTFVTVDGGTTWLGFTAGLDIR